MKTLLNRLIATRETPPIAHSTQAAETDRGGAHREIVAMALRDVLRKFGIPVTWITANPQSSTTAKRGRGVHLHLMVRDWHPQLLVFLVAVERQVRARILRLDPFSAEWLTGISWKFDLVDESSCPALPAAAFWQEYLRRVAANPTQGPDPRPDTLQRPPRPAVEDPVARNRSADREPAFLPTQPMAH